MGGIPGCAFAMPPLFWQFDKFAAGNAFPISGFVAFGTGVLGVLWWLGGWVVGIRYRRGPTGVRNMRAVLKKASTVRKGYSVPETPSYGTE